MQETLFVDLVEQALLAVPGRYRSEVFLAFFFGSDVAHLNYDKGILSCGTGREQDVGVQFARGAFDAVAEVFDERRCCCPPESAMKW